MTTTAVLIIMNLIVFVISTIGMYLSHTRYADKRIGFIRGAMAGSPADTPGLREAQFKFRTLTIITIMSIILASALIYSFFGQEMWVWSTLTPTLGCLIGLGISYATNFSRIKPTDWNLQ